MCAEARGGAPFPTKPVSRELRFPVFREPTGTASRRRRGAQAQKRTWPWRRDALARSPRGRTRVRRGAGAADVSSCSLQSCTRVVFAGFHVCIQNVLSLILR